MADRTPRPNFAAHLGVAVNVALDASPALLDALYRFTSAYTSEMEAEMAKLKTEIGRLDKAVVAAEEEKVRLEAEKAKMIADEADEDAAEVVEDETHAAAVVAYEAQVADLTAQRDALQKRVDEETASPAEEEQLADLISRIEKLGPAPEPTPLPQEEE
jgi:hypothetical protein